MTPAKSRPHHGIAPARGGVLNGIILRYLKATLICGALTALLTAGLFELHAFARLDAALALFLERPSPPPPVVGRVLQYFLILVLSFGITWTTIDLNSVPLKLGITLAEFLCFLFFWGINMFVVYKGIESIRLLLNIKAPLLIVLGLALLAWAYQAAGGFGPILSQPSAFASFRG